MAKNYQRHSTGGSFKRQDFGDLGLRSYREQQKEITEALRLQQSRSKEYGDEYVTALKGVGKSEEENKRILNELETKAYETRRRAIGKRAETEVAYIRSQAAEAGRKADYWKDFSTTYSKQWGKLAQGFVEYGDYRFAKQLQEDDDFQSKINKKYISPHTIQDEGHKIVEGEMVQNAFIEQDPYFSKKIIEETLSSSKTHGENILKKYTDNAEHIEKTFHKVGGNRLTASNTEEKSEDFIDRFLGDANVHPNSTAGKKIRALWRTRIITGLNGKWDKDEYDNDHAVSMKLVEAINANPTTANIHKLVEHLRSAHYKDEDGKIHSTTTKRNPAETWIVAAAYQLEYGDRKLTWMNSAEQFQNIFFDHPILGSKEGDTLAEIFSEKGQQRISQWLPKAAKAMDENTKAEATLVKNKKEIEPLARMENEIRERGHEATLGDWRPAEEGGWILTNEKWFRDNASKEAQKKFYDRIKLNPKEHKDVAIAARLMDSLEDTSPQGIAYSGYLLEYIEDNPKKYGDIQAYMDLPGVKENLKAYIEAGVFSDPIFATWSKNTVKEYVKKESLVKDINDNAILAEQQLEFYRKTVFDNLDPEEFKTSKARLLKAQEITKEEFEKGIPKGDKDGTGYFKAISINNTGVMTLQWDFGQAPGDNHVFNSYQFLQKLENANNDWSLFEKGDIINQAQAQGIVSNILQGSWDFKIPENVKTYAALRNLDPREALDSILENMGFSKIKTPVTSQDQFITSITQDEMDDKTYLAPVRANLQNIKRNLRHDKSMMMWNSFVKQKLKDDINWKPIAGPSNNPNFEVYLEKDRLVNLLKEDEWSNETDRLIKQNSEVITRNREGTTEDPGFFGALGAAENILIRRPYQNVQEKLKKKERKPSWSERRKKSQKEAK